MSFLLLVLTAPMRMTSATTTPTPAPTIVRDPDHEFDFRGCTDGVDVADAFDASGGLLSAAEAAKFALRLSDLFGIEPPPLLQASRTIWRNY